jgi:two-component system LytT family sensor kinase
LIIHLKNNNRQLIVTNNLQSRLNVTNSKGVGLSNLKKTYNLISEEQPGFYKNEIEFVAKLPLIERI